MGSLHLSLDPQHTSVVSGSETPWGGPRTVRKRSQDPEEGLFPGATPSYFIVKGFILHLTYVFGASFPFLLFSATRSLSILSRPPQVLLPRGLLLAHRWQWLEESTVGLRESWSIYGQDLGTLSSKRRLHAEENSWESTRGILGAGNLKGPWGRHEIRVQK